MTEAYKAFTEQGDVLDHAPEYASNIADLIRLASNYDWSNKLNPLPIFLVLTDYYGEIYGEEEASLRINAIGYLEMSHLAAALDEYSSRPLDCLAFMMHALDPQGAAE